MEKYQFNEHRNKKFMVQTMIVPGTMSRGTATIYGSCRNFAWGQLVCGQSRNFHIFNLEVDKHGKVIDCTIHPKEHFFDKNGNLKGSGTEDECRTLFEVWQGNSIDAEELAERKLQRKKAAEKLAEEKHQRGILIKGQRQQLKNKLIELSKDKTINQQLADKELQTLAAEMSLFNLLYPDRKLI